MATPISTRSCCYYPSPTATRSSAGFKLERQPKDNEIVDTGRAGGFFAPPSKLVLRGKYLCLGFSNETLKRLTGDPLAGVTAAEKKQFGDADILLYLGELVPGRLSGADTSMRWTITSPDAAAMRRRRSASNSSRGWRDATQLSESALRRGGPARGNMVFDVAREKAAAAMLDMLKAGTNQSSVRGLPEGRAAAPGWGGGWLEKRHLDQAGLRRFPQGPLPGPLNQCRFSLPPIILPPRPSPTSSGRVSRDAGGAVSKPERKGTGAVQLATAHPRHRGWC